jgi:hypothetical protein
MATTSFLLDEFTGTDAQVRVTLTDQAAGTVRVKLEVVSTTTDNLGDLVGFFVNFNNFRTYATVTCDRKSKGTAMKRLDCRTSKEGESVEGSP